MSRHTGGTVFTYPNVPVTAVGATGAALIGTTQIVDGSETYSVREVVSFASASIGAEAIVEQTFTRTRDSFRCATYRMVMTRRS